MRGITGGHWWREGFQNAGVLFNLIEKKCIFPGNHIIIRILVPEEQAAFESGSVSIVSDQNVPILL